jgi:hypothetical protein
LVEVNEITPAIDKVFRFDEAPSACEYLVQPERRALRRTTTVTLRPTMSLAAHCP